MKKKKIPSHNDVNMTVKTQNIGSSHLVSDPSNIPY